MSQASRTLTAHHLARLPAGNSRTSFFETHACQSGWARYARSELRVAEEFSEHNWYHDHLPVFQRRVKSLYILSCGAF
jgi:hypothetical protein